MKIITADQAAALLQDHWTLVPGGFGSCGHPDAVTQAIQRRFLAERRPRGLTLLFAAGAGDKTGRGLDALAHEDLVHRAIGGFWGLAPKLTDLVRDNRIEAHNWPQGVISQLFRATAARLPGVISRTGLGTFVDPDEDGGRLNRLTQRSLVRKIAIGDEAFLFYPAQPINCALVRGTTSDGQGNISGEDEVSFQDSLAQSTAARNTGGIVIAQVERLVENGSIQPHDVRVPGVLVDYVVVADTAQHPQTYGTRMDRSFVTAGQRRPEPVELTPQHMIIARRAAEEIRRRPGALVNLGIGMPAAIGRVANELGLNDFVLTVESGQIGGTPASGLSFGASTHPQAVIEQSALFDLYDGGGLDLAFLGFAEADSAGHVNVSRFANKMPGAGGFINISQNAKVVVFCGTLTARNLEVKVTRGQLRIVQEGKTKKFVQRVGQVTFNGERSLSSKQKILFVTERAVFSLVNGVLRLDEIAPGIDIETHIVPQMDAHFVISPGCKLMPSSAFEGMQDV